MNEPTDGNDILFSNLERLGFKQDPFDFPEAEKMPDGLWERLFVKHPGFNEIQNLEKSAVLLAERGGGKTAHRLRFANTLKLRPNCLVVNYANFEPITQYLPTVHTRHHFNPMMASIAKALLEYIKQPHNKEQFLEKDKYLPLKDRRWLWTFVKNHLGSDLQFELDNDLRIDFEGLEVAHLTSPIQENSSLYVAIQNIIHHINSLNISYLFILVDGVDGLNELNNLDMMTALVNPLLNGLSLLSINGVVWKFFLPKELEEGVHASSGYRTGRLPCAPIQWEHDSLIKMLNNRLKWASDGLYLRIEELCSQKLLQTENPEKELTKMAMRHMRLGPPRALLELSRQLINLISGERVTITEWAVFRNDTHSELRPSIAN